MWLLSPPIYRNPDPSSSFLFTATMLSALLFSLSPSLTPNFFPPVFDRMGSSALTPSLGICIDDAFVTLSVNSLARLPPPACVGYRE